MASVTMNTGTEDDKEFLELIMTLDAVLDLSFLALLS
jgi:hypothetical protein